MVVDWCVFSLSFLVSDTLCFLSVVVLASLVIGSLYVSAKHCFQIDFETHGSRRTLPLRGHDCVLTFVCVSVCLFSVMSGAVPPLDALIPWLLEQLTIVWGGGTASSTLGRQLVAFGSAVAAIAITAGSVQFFSIYSLVCCLQGDMRRVRLCKVWHAGVYSAMNSAAGAVGVAMGLARLLSQNVLLPGPHFVHHAQGRSGVNVASATIAKLPSSSSSSSLSLPWDVTFQADVGWIRRVLWAVGVASVIGGGVAVSGLHGSTSMFAALIAYRDLPWFSLTLTVLLGLHALTRVCARPTFHLPFPISLCLVALRSTLYVHSWLVDFFFSTTRMHVMITVHDNVKSLLLV